MTKNLSYIFNVHKIKEQEYKLDIKAFGFLIFSYKL
jgi:hypothetical protein